MLLNICLGIGIVLFVIFGIKPTIHYIKDPDMTLHSCLKEVVIALLTSVGIALGAYMFGSVGIYLGNILPTLSAPTLFAFGETALLLIGSILMLLRDDVTSDASGIFALVLLLFGALVFLILTNNLIAWILPNL